MILVDVREWDNNRDGRCPNVHEKDAVGEPRQGIHLAISIGESGVGWPLAHDGCTQPDYQRKAVKEHVNAVTEQTKRAGQEAIGQLNEHEGEVQTRNDQFRDWETRRGHRKLTT